MARTLQPESRIAHYRVIGPLGAGGMGEVYLAQDTKLERNVALKILPPELVTNEDRVRRFMLEAKSASSLNHPHIVTIYEVGHDRVLGADGSEDPGLSGEQVHYIAMELVTGKTVKDLVHVEGTDLKTMLGYLAQAAEGLAKAHAAGIVHRDLKPGNIMVTADGYAKVLDFGLAKLTEKSSDAPQSGDAPTATGDVTGAGMVLGTVGYMAPEQVRGKGIDHRVDIFAFGCLLYEAATRNRPFEADTQIDTLHQILHDQPRPIEELNKEVPTELRRLIRRCLAKNAEQRLQSIKDVALELREIVDEYDKLPVSGTSATVITENPRVDSKPRRRPVAGIAAIAILGLVGIAFGVYSLMSRDAAPAVPQHFASVQMRGLLSVPNLGGAKLSRDGRFLAYLQGPAGEWSLRVRQVATGSDVEILPPSTEFIGEFVFSPDGDYLYLLKPDPDTPNYSALFEVPSLGGTLRKRLFDVDTAISFSPEGNEVAFLRGIPQERKSALLVADLSGGEPRHVVDIVPPEVTNLSIAPSWSPDGSRIVVMIQSSQGGIQAKLVAFDAVTGERREAVLGRDYLRIDSFEWVPDGSGLIVSGLSRDALSTGIELVSFPEGERRAITSDLDNYGAVSISSDCKSIAALRRSGAGTLWISELDSSEPARQVTFDANEGVSHVRPAADGSIVFAATSGGFRQLFSIAPDGSGRQAITSGQGHVIEPRLLPDGAGVVYTLFGGEKMVGHVYRADLDGGDVIQLTDGSGEHLSRVTPDGQTVLFSRGDTAGTTWSVSIDGGEPEKFLEHTSMSPIFSADGRWMAYGNMEEFDGRQRSKTLIAPAGGGEPVHQFFMPPGALHPQWAPDGEHLSYVTTSNGVQNLWIHPLAGGDPVRVTKFTEGRINGYRWNKAGTRLIAVRILGAAQSIWTIDAATGKAQPVAEFRSGLLSSARFAEDESHVSYVYGDNRVDVVMIRDTGQ